MSQRDVIKGIHERMMKDQGVTISKDIERIPKFRKFQAIAPSGLCLVQVEASDREEAEKGIEAYLLGDPAKAPYYRRWLMGGKTIEIRDDQTPANRIPLSSEDRSELIEVFWSEYQEDLLRATEGFSKGQMVEYLTRVKARSMGLVDPVKCLDTQRAKRREVIMSTECPFKEGDEVTVNQKSWDGWIAQFVGVDPDSGKAVVGINHSRAGWKEYQVRVELLRRYDGEGETKVSS